jgi:hypothetical protein
MNRNILAAAAFVLAIVLSGCSQSTAETALPGVTVYKSASCGCCKIWVERLRAAGFEVQTHDVDNLNSVKQRVGIPYGMGSCHTAEVDGYFVEGHVPVEDIKRLLRERPKAKGITVPGMPAGSPGMELPSGKTEKYDVLLVAPDGSTSVFAQH